MSRAELYNQVLDEPNMLECILQHMRDPADVVHLSLCGKSNLTRFHDTIQTVLLEKHEDLIAKKLGNFARQVTVYVNQVLSIPGDNRQSLDNLFEFLLENMWYQKTRICNRSIGLWNKGWLNWLWMNVILITRCIIWVCYTISMSEV